MREADLAQGNDDFYASIAKVSTTCVGIEYVFQDLFLRSILSSTD